mgnify:CR=1 FL=1
MVTVQTQQLAARIFNLLAKFAKKFKWNVLNKYADAG